MRTITRILLVMIAPVMSRAAESTPPAPETARYVLIVANNKSARDAVQDLQYADDDGVLYWRLLSPYADGIELLTQLDDDSQRRYPDMAERARGPTRKNLEGALASLFARMTDDARSRARHTELIFVFVGHGGLDTEGKGYVHLSDGLFTRADLFHEIIAASPAETTHLIIDACNAFSLVAGRGEDPGSRRELLREFLSGNDLADYPSVGVLAATSDDHQTHEWSRIRAGIFSHQVRSALSGAADVNHDGRLEYSEIAAFVDAANSGLAGFGKVIDTFAWPPQRDRHAPLVDLRSGKDIRYLVLAEGLAGHFFLESEAGERWAEFHKVGGERAVITLPATLRFFLRDQANETEISPGSDVVWLGAAPTSPYALASRGAVDRAFEQGLFRVPFSDSFYRGFVSGRTQLLPVNEVEQRFLIDRAEPPRPATLEVEAGYVGGPFVLKDDHFEHGVSARMGWAFGTILSFGARIEAAYTSLADTESDSASRFALMPSLEARQSLSSLVSAHGAIEVGYAVLAVSGKKASTDASVLVGRARIGLAGRLLGRVWMQLSGGLGGYMVTVSGSEKIKARPEVLFGLGWRD